MKKFLSILVMTGLLFSPVSMAAESPKIGIINIAKIMQESKQAEKAREQLKKQFTPKQEELTKLQDKIQKAQEKLTRDKAVMAKKDLQKLNDEYETDKRDFQRKQQAFMQDLQTEQGKIMRDLSQDLNKIIQDIAAEKHYDLILQRDQVVFASETVDITETVLKKLNK